MTLGHFDASDGASFLLIVGLGVALWAGSRRQWRNVAWGLFVATLGLAASFLH